MTNDQLLSKQLSGRVVWFSPYSAIDLYSQFDHSMAQYLQAHGADITLIRCAASLKPWCACMSACNLVPTDSVRLKESLCRLCVARGQSFSQQGSYETVWMDTLLKPEDQTWTDELLADFSDSDLADLEVDGIPLGRWAASRAMLNCKDVRSTSPAVQRLLRKELHGTLAAFRAGVRAVNLGPFDNALVQSFQYAPDRAFLAGLDLSEDRLFSMQWFGDPYRAGERFGTFRVGRLPVWGNSKRAQISMSYPLSPSEGARVREYMRRLVRTNSPFVYSSSRSPIGAGEIRNSLGLSSNDRVAVVLTSSPDELEAARVGDLLPPELDAADDRRFIQTILEVAEQCDSLQFVIRVHPRLFPNTRENISSPFAEELLEALESRGKNVHIDIPAHGRSLYDLMLLADVAINYRSSAGIEFLGAGIPVVALEPSGFDAYPPSLNVVVPLNDTLAVAKGIQDAMVAGWSFERVALAMRWHATFQYRLSLPSPTTVDVLVQPTHGLNAKWLRRHVAALTPFALRRRNSIRIARNLATSWQYRFLRNRLRLASNSALPNDAIGATHRIPVGELLDGWSCNVSVPIDSALDSEFASARKWLHELHDLLAPWDGHEGLLTQLNKFVNP